jgi:hypothetical protein
MAPTQTSDRSGSWAKTLLVEGGRSAVWVDVVLVSLLALILTLQLLIPPFIGLADNGDFPKIAGLLCLHNDGTQNFRYFVSNYAYSQRYCYDRGLRFSGVIPAAAAIHFSRLIRGTTQFDIRYLGMCYAIGLLVTFYLLLVFLRRYPLLVRVSLAAFVLWIFSDVAYVSYFNSFYSDTIALLSLLLMVVTALHIVANKQPRWIVWTLFTAACVLFVTSKAQHGLWAIFPAGFAVWSAMRSQSRSLKIYSWALCAVLLSASAIEFFIATPKWYKATALYSVVFLKVLKSSPTPNQDITSLGLSPMELRNVGLSPWAPHSRVANLQWLLPFYDVTSRSLLSFYLHHPRRVWRILVQDLRTRAPLIRSRELPNFRQEDGYPPGALATRFSSWSSLRSRLLSAWPSHIIVWYLLLIIVATLMLVRHPCSFTRGASAICLGVAAMALLEFCFASLTDALQTERHLFLFQAMTDVTVCFGAGALLTGSPRQVLFRR